MLTWGILGNITSLALRTRVLDILYLTNYIVSYDINNWVISNKYL